MICNCTPVDIFQRGCPSSRGEPCPTTPIAPSVNKFAAVPGSERIEWNYEPLERSPYDEYVYQGIQIFDNIGHYNIDGQICAKPDDSGLSVSGLNWRVDHNDLQVYVPGMGWRTLIKSR